MGLLEEVRFDDPVLGFPFQTRSSPHYGVIISVGHRDFYFLPDGRFDGTSMCLDTSLGCPHNLEQQDAGDPT